MEGYKQLPGKSKLEQTLKNISTESNQEVKENKKQNELAPKTGKQQPLLNKPKPSKKAADKSELKCKPIVSQSTTATEPKKDLGIQIKIHQGTVKVKDSLVVTSSNKRESEPPRSVGSGNDVAQCTGTAMENTKSLEASKELSTQDEIIVGKLLELNFGSFYTGFVLSMYTVYKPVAGVVHATPPGSNA